MPIPIKMPALSPTMTTGHLIVWHKQINDIVRSGDLLLEIETDKAVMEVEATQSGILDHVAVPAGTNDVLVGKIIAVLRDSDQEEGVGAQWLRENGEDVEMPLESVQSPGSGPAEKAAAPVTPEPVAKPNLETNATGALNAPDTARSSGAGNPAPAPIVAQSAGHSHAFEPGRASVPALESEGRIVASPLAKKWAEKHAMPLHHIQGTGPRGRIVKDDVMRVLCHGPDHAMHASADAVGVSGHICSEKTGEHSALTHFIASGTPEIQPEIHAFKPILAEQSPLGHTEAVRVPMTGMRKTIAQRLTLSKQTVPHFSLTVACRMDALLSLRCEMNGSEKGLSVNDFMVRACAMALRAVPDMRLMWGDETHALQHHDVDLAVAVSVPGGLITPIVRQADTKTLRALSAELKGLIERARQGRLGASEYQGGLFTISNLGMMGIDQFTPIINPPHTGILAIGATKKIPLITPDGVCGVGQVMNVTVSADHRTIDGSVAALFLTTFQRFVEHPMVLVS